MEVVATHKIGNVIHGFNTVQLITGVCVAKWVGFGGQKLSEPLYILKASSIGGISANGPIFSVAQFGFRWFILGQGAYYE